MTDINLNQQTVDAIKEYMKSAMSGFKTTEPHTVMSRLEYYLKTLVVSEDEPSGSFELAEKIQRWIGDQDYFGEPLLHASVCCDHAGRMRFIKALRKLIKETDNEIALRMIEKYAEYHAWPRHEPPSMLDLAEWLTQQKEGK